MGSRAPEHPRKRKSEPLNEKAIELQAFRAEADRLNCLLEHQGHNKGIAKNDTLGAQGTLHKGDSYVCSSGVY